MLCLWIRLGPTTFSIGDTRDLVGEYLGGGIAQQAKMPQTIHFVCPSRSNCISTKISLTPVPPSCFFPLVGPFFSSHVQKSMRASYDAPKFCDTDLAKMDRPSKLHLGFRALHEFRARHHRLPKPWSKVPLSIRYSYSPSLSL